MKISVQKMVNQINMLLTVLTIHKIHTKVLPFKTRLIIIITKNIQKLKDIVEYKILGSNDFDLRLKLLKVSGKHSDWYNIKNLNDDTISSIDWKSMDKWKQYSQKEALINSSINNFSDFISQMQN